MTPNKGMGLGFKLLAAAALVAGATQMLSACSETESAEAEAETVAAAAALPLATEAPAEPLLTPISHADAAITEEDDQPGFRITSPLTVDGEMAFGEYAWNADGVPQGELRIIVDLQAERLYAYRGGFEIGRAVILYGHDDTPTPTGSFTITEKNRDHISNLYFVPMPFMMRLTNDGIAIHGSMVEQGYASRGCVGIPDDFAELLFNEAEIGTRVLITRGSPIVDGNRVVGI
ncbi:L,D-transpeptidase family protein [Parasphingopyxis algicola]|uniref:L,D-transpeptidase family protein n=1 Tax=Parasphingopyxis algicola TaxID=2026624 RepID=UPI00159FFA89|nr:L,D-transpeptidase family protein [Parasphingopyxis algicola]QLC24053.1 L,D-transpeptidase family protein [Parasphingopyxis algicola]